MLQVRRSPIQKKAQDIEKESSYIFLFHCSGLTSKQWRHPKNILCTFQGRTLFQPSCKWKLPHKTEQGGFFAQLASSAGPTCFFYLTKEAPDQAWSQLLPPAYHNQNLVLLYGQHRYTLVNHMDIQKAADSKATSVFPPFFLLMVYPWLYLCFCFSLFAPAKGSDGVT
uniref:Ribosomal protein L10 n=1 Tax=Phlegmariurus squarrosus TaxID=73615 RepID=H9M817_PHLSQ|nr:ribosomal protein L10 [Phlegmariurus squarrosus]YP_010704309.1 ribosomal protein L10 [Huperzia crispata]AEV55724.1 ribosomal protein L10 [Phlegmariurus squarrosus]WCP18585.1 ribosomal protein L10 [Huperzia crispata]